MRRLERMVAVQMAIVAGVVCVAAVTAKAHLWAQGYPMQWGEAVYAALGLCGASVALNTSAWWNR